MKMQSKYKTLTLVGGLVLVGVAVGGVGLQTRYMTAERASMPSLPSAPVESLATSQELDTLKNDIADLKQDTSLETLKDDIAHLRQDKDQMHQVSTYLNEELARLRLQVEQMAEMTAGNLTQPKSSENVEAPATEPDVTSDEAEQGAATESQSDAQVGLLEETLLAEAPDPQWSATATQSLYDAFKEVDTDGFVFQSAECKSTMCRLSLFFDQEVDAGEAFRKMTTAMPWNGAGFVRMSDETGEVEVYFAREGHGLPQMMQ